MKLEKYALKVGSDPTVFEFESDGPMGTILKLVLFQETLEPDLYNLAFGDKDLITGEMNDMTISNYGDTDKVLATVVAALYVFFDHFPDALVYATGSTPARTRLYRIGIVRFYTDVQRDFFLYGQTGDDFPVFEIGKNYDGFLVKQKFE